MKKKKLMKIWKKKMKMKKKIKNEKPKNCCK